MIEKIFMIFVAHALCDFAFQSQWMAKAKNRNNTPDLLKGQIRTPIWFYVLGSHALIHGGVLIFLTGLPIWIGMIEFILHFCIDFLKCDSKTTVHQDQLLHFICKLFYIPFLVI